MPVRTPRFGIVARQRQAEFRATLSDKAQRPADNAGIRNPHLLAVGSEMENLFPALRGPDGALAFFRERGIKWWKSTRSGDRSAKDGFDGPTRNLASSQVGCVNALLPLNSIPGALTAFLRCIDEDVEDVVAIIDQDGRSSYVEFEWVGWDRPLEGGPMTRGANQTSIDAFMVARIPQGHRAYVLEWKYTEEYLNPEDKGQGSSGNTRRTRYQHLFQQPGSSFNRTATLENYFFEPFYQIMRLLLLADRMRSERVTPDLPVDGAKVIVVCPAANYEYRRVVKSTPLGRLFPTLYAVEDVVRATLNDETSFSVVAPEEIIGKLRKSELRVDLQEWLDYHATRYGW